MEMADRLLGDTLPPVFWDRNVEFLFLDLDLGRDSLAMRCWPRFRNRAAREKFDALSLQYQYLVRMEPLSTVDMYVRCWKEFQGDEPAFYEALSVFSKFPVPYRKREQIHIALADYVERNVGNVHNPARGDEQDLRMELLTQLKEKLLPITDPERARDLVAELRMGSPKYKPEDVAAWLAHGEPMHPAVRMLADVNEPKLRVLALGALQEHPTPGNRALLQKLLGDSDEEVRKAAEAVATKLTILKETPIAQFADRRTGPAVP